MGRITATSANYIKLGPNGRWEKRCLREGTLRFGYAEIGHELARSRDKEAIRQFFVDRGHATGAASDHARQIMAFYNSEPDQLWVTFADGHLWWCFAETEVVELELTRVAAERDGARLRQTVGGWHNRNINGEPLRISELNGALTRLASYRMTVCQVRAFDYLVRKINGEDLPEVAEARKARKQTLESIRSLMRLLTWQDFELLVELVFSGSGWRRIGSTGGAQKTIDLDLVLPSTGERAFVQVKSQTNQAQLEEYLDHLNDRDEDKMFYAYHTAKGRVTTQDPRAILLGPQELAPMVLEAGLFDWLLKRAA